MASSKCLKHDNMFLQTFSECTSLGSDISGYSLFSPGSNVLERIWMQKEANVCLLLFTTSTVVHTEWPAAAVHTEEQCGPNSGPPHPCPSGWAARCWRCCPLNRGGCHSCCPATSWVSGRESLASRGQLSSWPGWAAAEGRTPASWVSLGGWWGREDPGQGSVEQGLYADGGLGRWWRGQGGVGCPGCPVYLC